MVALLLSAHPHLTPTSQPGIPPLSESLNNVAEIPQRATVLGYERETFTAGWAQLESCTVREELIAHQFQLTLGHACRIPEEAVGDPYTGRAISTDEIEIDHIFPLSAAWDLGAHSWSRGLRETFANDPVNLVATASRANQEKSDDLPAVWLPPDPGARCWYSQRLAAVAAKYALALPAADISVMRNQCRWALPQRPD